MKNVALITGASSGIGLHFAHIHAERKGDLVLVARREEKLLELQSALVKEHGVQVKVISADLCDPSALEDLYTTLSSEGIEIDFLINNAGFGGHGNFHESDWAVQESMIQLNISALTQLCHLFLPDFIKRGTGRVLNISSTASLPPGGPLQAVYFATKHYVTAFSYGIAGELEGTGVTVTALLPGAKETEFAKVSGMDKTELFSKAVSARSVAEDGYEGMIAGKLEVISGLTTSQKLMMAAIPFTPKKMLLSQIKEMQEVK